MILHCRTYPQTRVARMSHRSMYFPRLRGGTSVRSKARKVRFRFPSVHSNFSPSDSARAVKWDTNSRDLFSKPVSHKSSLSHWVCRQFQGERSNRAGMIPGSPSRSELLTLTLENMLGCAHLSPKIVFPPWLPSTTPVTELARSHASRNKLPAILCLGICDKLGSR